MQIKFVIKCSKVCLLILQSSHLCSILKKRETNPFQIEMLLHLLAKNYSF